MQYMLLIYDDDSAWENVTQEQMEALYGEYRAVAEHPGTRGGGQLQPVTTATTVRVVDGETVTTDGPFTETKEHLGGYYVIEAESLDEAIELAARIPSARMGGGVEVRPLVER